MADSTPRVIVAQHGSRHRYMVARLLEQAGCLEALYTDATCLSPLGRIAAAMKSHLPRSGFRRLADRVPADLPPQKVFTTDRVTLYSALRSVIKTDRPNEYSRHAWKHAVLSRRMIAWGVQNADWLYTMHDESLPFIQHAKHHGVRSVVDVIISPVTHRIMAAEMARYPGLLQQPLTRNPGAYEQHLRTIFRLADRLSCPSPWVADGVRELAPDCIDKIRVVPYGCSLSGIDQPPDPVRGRILFCGNDAFRKGILILGYAAQQLKHDPVHCEFRIAGAVDSAIQQHSACTELNFLGHLNRASMAEEFRRADMFVLPTLSEGLAGVVVEALSAHLPVITTVCAGADITHGETGLLVPPGRPDDLVRAIRALLTDRSLRDRLAGNAETLARVYAMEQWKDRLIRLFEE